MQLWWSDAVNAFSFSGRLSVIVWTRAVAADLDLGHG